MSKILFIDLDHTLITTRSGKKFPIHSADWKFIPETIEFLIKVKHDYKIAIVTNQGGIEMGFIAEKVFIKKITDICIALEKILKLKDNSIIYRYCPNMKSYYRKPNPGMIYDIALEEEVSLKDSIMIGDMDSDKELVLQSGITHYIDVNELPNYS